jgi:hypothetical protein
MINKMIWFILQKINIKKKKEFKNNYKNLNEKFNLVFMNLKN